MLDLGTDFKTAKEKLEKLQADRKFKNGNVTCKGLNLNSNANQTSE